MKVTILGAGQDVGRSCVLLTFPTRRLILDCGAHCGFVDHKRYPALQMLGPDGVYEHQLEILEKTYLGSQTERQGGASDGPIEDPTQKAVLMRVAMERTLNDLTNTLDCAIISHFHLDHVGALPFLTEQLKFNGPVYMTWPTKALSPILLRDSAQVTAQRTVKQDKENLRNLLNMRTDSESHKRRKGADDPWGYNLGPATESVKKAIALQLQETRHIGNIKITPYYAGHVLGAAMFHVECDGFSVLYTGDFNTVPDKHLGPAKVPRLCPDVLICESTYATVVRQPRKATEMELCTVVHDTLLKGGKVLIPVFAVGRAQELAIILDSYWSKLELKYPIYFGGGLSEKATNYYKLHSCWTNEHNIPGLNENTFSMSYIQPFDNGYLNENRPMVLFATPGMVHAGLSLRACKLWAPNPNNLIVIPGYCVQGTVGNKLISGEKVIQTSAGPINVKCKVRYLSFSAHADSAGIIQLARQVSPKNILLVHGESESMKKFSKHLNHILGVPVHCPANGYTVEFEKEKREDIQDVYLHPELFLEASGMEITKEDPPSLEISASPAETVEAIALVDKQGLFLTCRENVFLSTKGNCLYMDPGSIKQKSQTASSGESISPLHQIIHKQKRVLSEDKFMEFTELISRLIYHNYAFIAKELKNGGILII
ncbi:cleavage and polyadenylation specificity factor, putative [Theileria equi strain WA]|uniref:Cleavage and polyadenylation specificity factor, putative n=1 Tax=Theileria equi strain WA TaxID=1537102 RepID=L1LBF2_THEEQ|nr:cleavage and polyadenylation specificity factor, putative [Theileria equi strain WA]EKX72498.1 cleavage and polyadenylation specificity factor, putative [Theileria equi strain WA]|eukprot:XP_004831950.1 cleavage and polyadenylation specificity factor, putative [Theileria equi strain WA]